MGKVHISPLNYHLNDNVSPMSSQTIKILSMSPFKQKH
jgi:hypothetical protein